MNMGPSHKAHLCDRIHFSSNLSLATGGGPFTLRKPSECSYVKSHRNDFIPAKERGLESAYAKIHRATTFLNAW